MCVLVQMQSQPCNMVTENGYKQEFKWTEQNTHSAAVTSEIILLYGV